MHTNQQQLQFDQQHQQQLHFSPISSCVTNMGTTVTYSIRPQNNVNAYNSNCNPSGSFMNFQDNIQQNLQQVTANQAGWNQSSWNQMGQNISTYSTFRPYISANQFGQQNSGNIMFQNQLNWQQRQQLQQLQLQQQEQQLQQLQLQQQEQQLQQLQLQQQSFVAQPGIDISETSSDVIVSAFVPNVAIEDMSLNVTENSVTISGSAWTNNQNLLLSRTVALPTSVRAESVDANLVSGVLEIRLPKTDKNVAQRATVTNNQNQTM